MLLNHMKSVKLTIFFLVQSIFVFAQKGAEIGGGLGLAHYFGDLNPTLKLDHAGYDVHGVARYNFNSRLALKFALNYGRISGSDEGSSNQVNADRNLNFWSDIFDVGAQLEFNFLDYYHGSRTNNITPYAFAGFSNTFYSPKTDYEGTTYSLREVRTEGQFQGDEYGTTTLGIIYGMGLKYSLNYRWSIDFELSSRLLFTDYLDDVSTVYPDLDDGIDPVQFALADRSIEVAGIDKFRAGQQRGNSNNNDFYSIFTISILYFMGEIECP